MIREAVVLSGGFGTRLRSLIEDIPKTMAPVNGKPFLELLFDYLCSYNIERIILSTGHLSEIIEDYFGNSYKSASIIYSVETEPLGTGGAVLKAIGLTRDKNILVVNGDTLFKVDINELEQKHISNWADITIALRDVADCSRYGTITMDENCRISSFNEKTGKSVTGSINGGVYLIKKMTFVNLNLPAVFSIEKDLFTIRTSDLRFFGMSSNAYFIDIGTPEDYNKAENELQ